MKKTVLACAAILACLASHAAPIKSSQDFLDTIKAAMTAQDMKLLHSLIYDKGMPEADKTPPENDAPSGKNAVEIASITLDPLPKGYQTLAVVSGVRYEPTYPPAGLVAIRFAKNPGGPDSTSMPYAIVDGAYYLVATKKTDLNWKGPPDSTIGYFLIGQGTDKVAISGKYNVSGVDLGGDFSAASMSLTGQYISEMTVVSNSDDVHVTLVILQDGKRVFTSEPLIGRGTIEYRHAAAPK